MTQQYDFFKEYGLNFDKSEREQLRPKNTIVLDNEEEIFESPIPEGQKLKKKDLYRYENINTIRDYMSANKGADYVDMDQETLVEDF